jgi:DNA-binding SARP family transcriptional activator
VLGRDALGPRGGNVRLAPEVPFRSDLAAFDQAAPRGDPAATVAQYAGPFLDGVFVERAPRFEMSAANERECRRREFVAACETLAPRQGVRGRPAGVRAVLCERTPGPVHARNHSTGRRRLTGSG